MAGMKPDELGLESVVASHAAPGVQQIDDESVFRVVTHNGKRHGFKIERIFWKVLQLAANAEGKRIGAYIEALIEAHSSRSNMSSVLRTHAAEWLSQRLIDSAGKSTSPRTLNRMVQSAPVPCFTMDHGHQIRLRNDLFVEFLRSLIAESNTASDSAVHLRLQTDVKVLAEQLADSKRSFIDDVLHVRFQTRTVSRSARITSIETMQGVQKGFVIYIMK